jgi:hypothetical protein
MHEDIEALARPEGREKLPFTRLLRLYLDPFALLKSVTAGPPGSQSEALRYNRRQRRMLLAYLRRWAVIGIACLSSDLALARAAPGEPLFGVPFLGFELGFSLAVCVLLLVGAVYLLLGVED